MPKIFTGKVVSEKMEKTVVVLVTRRVAHPLYRKVMNKKKKLYAHDEKGAKLGQKVRIKEVRPISKMKRFEVIEIVVNKK